MNSKIFSEFSFWSAELYRQNLVSALSGNLSLKIGSDIYITRKGSFLGFLKPADIVKVSLKSTCAADRKASRELASHRSILCSLPFAAVMHAHPPYTIAVSLKFKKIDLVDLEGKYYFPKVPIIETELKPGAKDLPQKLISAFKKSPVVIVRGHGVFAVGKNFAETFALISSLEASSQILWLAR